MDLAQLPRRTKRLLLSPFQRRDVDPLVEAIQASLPELKAWLPWPHDRYDRIDALRFIRDSNRAWREQRAYDFAITRPGEATHLGNVSIWYTSRPNGCAEIGYWIRTTETSTGVGTEATAAMLQVGFKDLGLHRITLRVAVGNRPSERIAEKLGFSREGTLREVIKVRDQRIDHSLYSLLRSEWIP